MKKLSRRFLGEIDYDTIRDTWIVDVADALERGKPKEAPSLREMVNFHDKHLRSYLRGDPRFLFKGAWFYVKQEYFKI